MRLSPQGTTAKPFCLVYTLRKNGLGGFDPESPCDSLGLEDITPRRRAIRWLGGFFPESFLRSCELLNFVVFAIATCKFASESDGCIMSFDACICIPLLSPSVYKASA